MDILAGSFGLIVVGLFVALGIMMVFAPLATYFLLRGMRKELETHNQQILRLTAQMNDRLGTLVAGQAQAGVSKVNSNAALYTLQNDNAVKVSANQLRLLVQQSKIKSDEYVHDGTEWVIVSSVV